MVDGTTIAVNFEGQVMIEEQGRGRLTCIQRLPFTFRRVAAEAADVTGPKPGAVRGVRWREAGASPILLDVSAMSE